jgi:hypothetical protein
VRHLRIRLSKQDSRGINLPRLDAHTAMRATSPMDMPSTITPVKRSALEAGLDDSQKDDDSPSVDGKLLAPKISKARACTLILYLGVLELRLIQHLDSRCRMQKA